MIMKIYFAGSIRGGRDDKELYALIIKELQNYGQVLTEHIGNTNLSSLGETVMSSNDIYTRDMDWVRESEVVVAEVSTPSLGVGYEIGQAEALGKKIICLYREDSEKRLSAMIAGNSKLEVMVYKDIEDIKEILKNKF